MSSFFAMLQRVGRAFMLPIALLPAAGILLGVGGSLLGIAGLENPPAIFSGLVSVIDIGWIHGFLTIIKNAGEIVFANLPLLFAIGIAVGLSKSDQGSGALAASIGFLIMHQAINSMLVLGYTNLGVIDPSNYSSELKPYLTTTLGIFTLNMSLFGGIIAGLVAAFLNNRYNQIELPRMLGFFGGSRFVPIITSFVMIFVGVILAFIWPTVQNAIASLAIWVDKLGLAGTLVYGIIERALIPFGLHHVFYAPFWYTDLVQGEVLQNGQWVLVKGAFNAYFAQFSYLGDVAKMSAEEMSKLVNFTTRFMAGKFPFMMFGLWGAAIAIYKNARPEKRKIVGGLIFSAAATAAITGITEPIEFTFLFVAPILYGLHCIMAGISFLLMDLFDVWIGMTFSGGLIDYTLFGLLPAAAGVTTNWIYVIIVGAAYLVIYYFMFDFFIRKFNLKTPGREDEGAETKLYSRADYEAKGQSSNDATAVEVLKAFGGSENIKDVDACITRLRVNTKDIKKVDRERLKSLGATEVMMIGSSAQAIFGGKSDILKNQIRSIIENGSVDTDISKSKPNEVKNLVSNEVSVDDSSSWLKVPYLIDVPITGDLINIEKVPDPTFAQKMVGDGFAINPKVNMVISPVSGKVTMVFRTKHAISLTTDDGLEVLIHIGLETTKLDGKPFEIFVKEGDNVKTGDKLASFDSHAIAEAGCLLVTPIVFTNLPDNLKVEVIEGAATAGEQGRIAIVKK